MCRAQELRALGNGCDYVRAPGFSSNQEARVFSEENSLRYLVDPERVAQRRASFKVQMNECSGSRIFYVDETGFRNDLVPVYGYSRKEQRLMSTAPKRTYKNKSMTLAISESGIGTTMLVDGPMNGERFCAFLELMDLKVSNVIVMDNVSFHKTRQVKNLLARLGAYPLYTPPYSPDYNPIENVFGVVKHYFKKESINNCTPFGKKIERALGKVQLAGVLNSIYHARTFW